MRTPVSKYAHLWCIITWKNPKFKTCKIWHVQHHLCLITEKSHPNTHQAEMHYCSEICKAIVWQIILHSPHIPHSISKPSVLSCKTYNILTTVIKEWTPCESLQSSILEAFPQPPPRPQQSPILVFTDVVQNTAHSYYSRQLLFSCLKPSSPACHLPFHFSKAWSIVILQLLKW